MGLDANRVGEGKIYSAEIDFYVWGYLADGWVFLDAGLDVTPETSGSWQDCHHANVPAGAKGVLVEMANGSGSTTSINIREKGSNDNITTNINLATTTHLHGIVGLDENGYFQAYLSSTTSQTVAILGYFLDELQVSMTPAYLSYGVPDLTESNGVIAKIAAKAIADITTIANQAIAAIKSFAGRSV